MQILWRFAVKTSVTPRLYRSATPTQCHSAGKTCHSPRSYVKRHVGLIDSYLLRTTSLNASTAKAIDMNSEKISSVDLQDINNTVVM